VSNVDKYKIVVFTFRAGLLTFLLIEDNVQAKSASVQCCLFQTWQQCLGMRSKCINFTSGRQSVTGN